MKITYITQACLLIEIEDIKILTDPWLVGPCWAGNLWHYPPPKRKPESFRNIDFLYLSHAHEDHFQMESINRLPLEIKDTQVIISDFDKPYFERAIRASGFKNVKVMKHDESTTLIPGVTLDMIRNDGGDDDSSIILQGDDSTVFCQTDNLMSLNEAERLGKKYDVDILFTMNTQTGIFPAFFDFPVETMMELSKKKIDSSAKYSINVAKALQAKTIIPYASDLCYLGELFFANDIHYADKNDYVKLAEQEIPNVEAYVMGPDDYMMVKYGKAELTINPQKYTRKELGAYNVVMREQVANIAKEERSYISEPYESDLKIFKKSLDDLTETWKNDSFKVLWVIVDPEGERTHFWHNLPEKTSNNKINDNYDLRIEIPTYRLQRLVRGDYPMGGITLRNGCVRCHRYVKDLTNNELQYWELTMKLKYNK
jgi:hypothetical protein